MENEPKLRIKPLPLPPEKQKITFRLPEPTLTTFKSYLAAYQEIYGREPDPDFVADQIFTSFFESDRAFAAYLKKDAGPEEIAAKKEKKKTAPEDKNVALGEPAQI